MDVRPVLEMEHASGILWASDVDIAGLANCRDGPGGVARIRANIPLDPQSNPWVTFANRCEIYFWDYASPHLAVMEPALIDCPHAGVVALHGRAPYTSAEQHLEAHGFHAFLSRCHLIRRALVKMVKVFGR